MEKRKRKKVFQEKKEEKVYSNTLHYHGTASNDIVYIYIYIYYVVSHASSLWDTGNIFWLWQKFARFASGKFSPILASVSKFKLLLISKL
jgi:hypothetical protein